MSDSRNNIEKECFVIMPFSDGEPYEEGHFRSVYDDIIKPAVEAAGFVPQRADDVQQTNLIHQDILKRLIDAPICICDLSARNPNVLFELGIRQAFDKPVVLIQEKGTPKIFDISILRILEYSKEMRYRDVMNMQNSLTEAIKATVSVETDASNVNSIIKLLSISVPASIPKLNKANREDLTLDVISSQILELSRKIDASYDSKRFNSPRNQFAIEQERISNGINMLAEMVNEKRPSPEFFRIADNLKEELVMARRYVSNSREEEALMRLNDRFRRVMAEMSSK